VTLNGTAFDRFDGDDWRWLTARKPAPQGRFNAGQKLIYWIVVLGGGASAITGYLLLFPFYGTGISGMQIAEVIHATVSVLFIAAMLGHIYIGTIGMEGAFEAMGTGTVDVNWAKEHHSLWLTEEGAKVGPDETQPVPASPRWFGIDTLVAPRLVAWAVKDSAPEARAAQALAAGFRLGPVEAGSRERPDGNRLAWRFTHPRVLAADGVVPFFIDWGEGAHPAQGAPSGVRFIGLRAEHPKPEPIVALLKEFGLPVHVKRGPAALVATLDTPRGAVELS